MTPMEFSFIFYQSIWGPIYYLYPFQTKQTSRKSYFRSDDLDFTPRDRVSNLTLKYNQQVNVMNNLTLMNKLLCFHIG